MGVFIKKMAWWLDENTKVTKTTLKTNPSTSVCLEDLGTTKGRHRGKARHELVTRRIIHIVDNSRRNWASQTDTTMTNES